MKLPYNQEMARAGSRIAPYIARAGAIILCAVATFVIGLFTKAVLFDGFPLERATPFFLIALLFYAGAAFQLAIVRWGKALEASRNKTPPES